MSIFGEFTQLPSLPASERDLTYGPFAFTASGPAYGPPPAQIIGEAFFTVGYAELSYEPTPWIPTAASPGVEWTGEVGRFRVVATITGYCRHSDDDTVWLLLVRAAGLAFELDVGAAEVPPIGTRVAFEVRDLVFWV